MNKKVISSISTPPATPILVLLKAEPEPLEIDLHRTCIIVIDMQNAFVSKEGYFDLVGRDISLAQNIIGRIHKIISTAQVKGIKVLYAAHQYSHDLHECGGPNSPHWYKGVLTSYREHPEWRDKLLTHGTWGAEIIDELKPKTGDIVVKKARYSAFFETNLDMILKTHNIQYLAFVGTATNICVEASIRDAFYLDYWPILVSDAAANVGLPLTQDATIFNVKLCYGWVTTSENLVKAIEQLEKVSSS